MAATVRVAPEAEVRILLTASEEARLARRAREVHGSADADAVAATRDQIVRRDADDSTVSDFTVAADGVVHLDSSALDFEQTVQAVLEIVSRTLTGDDLTIDGIDGIDAIDAIDTVDATDELADPAGAGAARR